MSRIGKKAIEIPENVLIKHSSNKIEIQGPFGKLELVFKECLLLSYDDKNKLIITANNNEKKVREYHGLIRVLIQNMVIGVTKKFKKVIIAEGIGYKFQLMENKLLIQAGYTHNIVLDIPEDIELKLESNTKMLIMGINKESTGLFASKVRSVRPPEPYKGKGFMYEGEFIKRKVGKKGK